MTPHRPSRVPRATALALVTLALSALLDNAQACTARDQWTGRDKALHLVAGAAVGAGVTAYTRDPLIGTFAGTAVGIAKEIRDSRGHGHCSAQDALITALGAAVGAYGASWALSRSAGVTWVSYRVEF